MELVGSSGGPYSAGIWMFIAWAFGAGVGSGLLGIGGGMILGPLLLELGVNPRHGRTRVSF